MSIEQLRTELEGSLRGQVLTSHPLAKYTTYRLGGPAALFVEPADVDDLLMFAEVARGLSERPSILALGRGSNLVISDEGWAGVVLYMGPAFSWLHETDDPYVQLHTGAGTTMPLLANWAARRGLAGLEFAIAIPGSVGGAIRMNAGAHGHDAAGCLASSQVLDLETTVVESRSPDDLEYSYRHSGLTKNHVVIDARWRLRPDDVDAVKNRMEAYRRHRAETQPGAFQNAGSVFKNPPHDSAGRLVEAAGLKGLRVGGATVSELHANFFIAGEGATSQDVFDLVHIVRETVRESFDVELEPEIRFAGPYEEPRAGAERVTPS
ncbi:MAG: UDP-N-acetylmuramate dehydrogenase [Actinomycetota bacterium]|nr:UDP-N-acetylmuramate dehydrogenase [Actinomycetota bacterium]